MCLYIRECLLKKFTSIQKMKFLQKRKHNNKYCNCYCTMDTKSCKYIFKVTKNAT